MWSCADGIVLSPFWLTVGEILPAVGLFFSPFTFPAALLSSPMPNSKAQMPNMLLVYFFFIKLTTFHILQFV